MFPKVLNELEHRRLANRDFSSTCRSSFALLSSSEEAAVASSGKKGPVIIASHRDCRDRLTHENVIRISLLPTALRNDCSTSLCNVVSLFPLPPPSSHVFHVYLLEEIPPILPRSSLSFLPREMQHEVGRLRSRFVGQLSQRINPPNVIGNWHLRWDRNWFLEMHDRARFREVTKISCSIEPIILLFARICSGNKHNWQRQKHLKLNSRPIFCSTWMSYYLPIYDTIASRWRIGMIFVKCDKSWTSLNTLS